jgi:site-specific recombinase XerD
VLHFLGCIEDIKHRAILTTCYAAGLRISEAFRLKASSLDNRRMVIHVAQGKGRKRCYGASGERTASSSLEKTDGVPHATAK